MKDIKAHAGFPIAPVYGPEDVADVEFDRDIGRPGEYPYTRGIHKHMYRDRLWTMRQYVGFGTPAETNAPIQVPDGARAGCAQRRLRPADAARPRLRRSQGGRRGRSGRDGGRHARRHGGSVRRHPARPRERVAHDQRHGRADHRHVLRRRREAGRGGRARGHHAAERHPERVHRTGHVDLSGRSLAAPRRAISSSSRPATIRAPTPFRSAAITSARPGAPPRRRWRTAWRSPPRISS